MQSSEHQFETSRTSFALAGAETSLAELRQSEGRMADRLSDTELREDARLQSYKLLRLVRPCGNGGCGVRCWGVLSMVEVRRGIK